ncbi:ParB/RepB/Spo0J family partition protein, partial [Anaerostipes hadrus]|uniref:ParB/RepB/Spo0J family partition protein n=1 Tax=Anaerostipes hadrus TaxID=649756 RepID=UPI001ADDE5F2
LQELADSIKKDGKLQAILGNPKEDFYEVHAGERRWEAGKKVGLNEVPVKIRKYNENEIGENALIEKIQRDNLKPIEGAMAYKRLMEEFELKQDEVATKV